MHNNLLLLTSGFEYIVLVFVAVIRRKCLRVLPAHWRQGVWNLWVSGYTTSNKLGDGVKHTKEYSCAV